MRYGKCKHHKERRHVSIYQFVKCPWCGYLVSADSPHNWCASCYTMFQKENNRVHFGKFFKKTPAQALAIAIAKGYDK